MGFSLFLLLNTRGFKIIFEFQIQMTEKDLVTSCRAVFEKDEKLITDKRIKIDEMVSSIPNVKFFISCITGTATTGKEKMGISPGISYVIISNKETTEVKVFEKFHDLDLKF